MSARGEGLRPSLPLLDLDPDPAPRFWRLPSLDPPTSPISAPSLCRTGGPSSAFSLYETGRPSFLLSPFWIGSPQQLSAGTRTSAICPWFSCFPLLDMKVTLSTWEPHPPFPAFRPPETHLNIRARCWLERREGALAPCLRPFSRETGLCPSYRGSPHLGCFLFPLGVCNPQTFPPSDWWCGSLLDW